MDATYILKKINAGNYKSNLKYCFSIILQQEVAESISPLTIPPPEGIDKPVSPKIEKIVSDITNLNLLEVSELSQVRV